MAYKTRRFTCSVCGRAVIRRAAAGAELRCVPCGIAHQAEVARQLHAHEGPEYENWRQAYLAAAARFAGPAEGQAEAEAGVIGG